MNLELDLQLKSWALNFIVKKCNCTEWKCSWSSFFILQYIQNYGKYVHCLLTLSWRGICSRELQFIQSQYSSILLMEGDCSRDLSLLPALF